MAASPSVDLFLTLTGCRFEGLDQAVIGQYLTTSAAQHDAGTWGAVYATAMVWHAAHAMETTPGLLADSEVDASTVGPLMMQKDDTLQRQYGMAPGSMSASGADATYYTTVWGLRYLALRGSRPKSFGFVASVI